MLVAVILVIVGSDLRSEEIYLPMTHEQLAPIEKKRGEEEN